MQNKLIKDFSFKLEGVIWNMLIDEEDKCLILEVRDVGKHSVSFSAIDLINKKLVYEKLTFDEEWWIGMSAILHSCVLFYIYENDQNPIPQKYFVYSLEKHTIIWESDDFKFIALDKDGFLGQTIKDEDNNQYLIVDYNGGSILVDNSYFYNLTINQELKKVENKISYYPFHYPEESDYFKSVENYLVLKHHIKPVKAIDYLEIGSAIVISYYIYSKDSSKEHLKFDNYLLILSKKGTRLFEEKIDGNLSGIGMGIFFVVENRLIFLKNKSEIISYQIDIYE